MGTYTTNYQLYMPTVGEIGWGTLVNGNFSTIDTTMKNLSNRIAAVENEVNGNLSCTSVTTSGKITGNGGIVGTTGTFSGAVTGASFNNVVIKSSGTYTVTPDNTIRGYLPMHSSSGIASGTLTILHPCANVLYYGSLRFRNDTSGTANLVYWNGSDDDAIQMNISAYSYVNITFSSVPFIVAQGANTGNVKLCDFTIS